MVLLKLKSLSSYFTSRYPLQNRSKTPGAFKFSCPAGSHITRGEYCTLATKKLGKEPAMSCSQMICFPSLFLPCFKCIPTQAQQLRHYFSNSFFENPHLGGLGLVNHSKKNAHTPSPQCLCLPLTRSQKQQEYQPNALKADQAGSTRLMWPLE